MAYDSGRAVRNTALHMSRCMRVPTDDQVFIIRCWNERRDIPAAPPQWRGRICNINSDTEIHFNDPTEVADFLAGCLADVERAIRDEASE